MSGSGPRDGEVDRLVVQQYDLRTLLPGGIDACLRGVIDYAPQDVTLAIVGVDQTGDPARRLGRWERYQRGARTVWFLPVARIDPQRPKGLVPHSTRLAAGLLRHRSAIPRVRSVQAHRVDLGVVTRLLFRGPLVYCIHTQERGLLGATSDSFWRFTGGLHERLDRLVARRADRVIVFNPDYAQKVRGWNARTQFSPTWFDPALLPAGADRPPADPYRVLWVGRLAVPKDPALALAAFAALARAHPDEPWRLELVGSGPLAAELDRQVAALEPAVAARITLRGRQDPQPLAELRAACGVFLMTSHPGYEGYPRVLVEAMAAGLPPVVTQGSDTGGLVQPGVSGFVCGRDPAELAERLRGARDLDRATIVEAVSAMSAPRVVQEVFFSVR